MDAPIILLAEDNDDDVVLVQLAFKRAGVAARLFVVRDGEEAIRYLGGEREYEDRSEYPFPDLFVLDLNLPRKNGVEVLHWLRREPGIGRLITLVYSGTAEAREINGAYEAGANGFIQKVVTLGELKEIVRKAADYWLHVNRGPRCRVK